jgi:adenosylmethionine-8-amino-7-oxononanoate aminotransferase
MGQVLQERLQGLRSCPSVGDVRGRGLLAGIEFVADQSTRKPFPPAVRFAEAFAAAALELGLVVWPNSNHLEAGSGDLAMIAPPYIITEEQIGEMVDLLGLAAERTLQRVSARR